MPDFWEFEVIRLDPSPLPKPGEPREVKPRETLLNDKDENGNIVLWSLGTLLKWIVKTAKTHRNSQKLITEETHRFFETKMCKHDIPLDLCDEEGCKEIDVEETYDLVTQSEYIDLTYNINLFENCYTFFKFLFGLMFFYYVIVLFHKMIQILDSIRVFMLRVFGYENRLLQEVGNLVVTKNTIMQYGEDAYTYLRSRRHVLYLATAVAGLAIMKKFYDSKYREQVDYVAPTPSNEKVAAKWVSDLKETSRLSFLPQVFSTKALDFEDFCYKITKNLAHVEFFLDGKFKERCNVLFIGGVYAIINTHVLELLPHECFAKFTFTSKSTHISRNTTIRFDKDIISSYYDVTIVRIPNFGIFRDISKYFPVTRPSGHYEGVSLYRNSNGDLTEIQVDRLKCHQISNLYKNVRKTYDVAEGVVSKDTPDGHCGSMLLVNTPYGYSVFGIHSLGGSDNKALSSMVYEPFITANTVITNVGNLDVNERQFVEQVESNKKDFVSEPVQLTMDLRCKDPLMFRKEFLVGEVYGSLSTGPVKPRSAVTKSYGSEFWSNRGFRTDKVKPVFDARAWHRGIESMMSAQRLRIPSGKVRQLCKSYFSDVSLRLSNEELELIELYDFQTAVNGANGVNYVNAMNFSTSFGFPLKKTKNKLFDQNKETGKWEIPFEFYAELSRIDNNAQKGNRNNPVFSASLKDEPRSQSKVNEGSIRIFMGANMTFCALVRIYFGSFIRVIQRSPLAFENAIGINAHSQQWDQLYHYLNDFDERVFDGDYKSFDKSMESSIIFEVLVACGDFICQSLQKTGKLHDPRDYNELQNVYYSIASDIAFAYIDYNGTLMTFLRNHVSGEPLTVIVNSIVNSIYMRLVYTEIYLNDPKAEKFSEIVRPLSYGDDLLVASKDNGFNFKTVQRILKDRFNITFTPADKTGKSYEFRNITEVDFLKRKFCFHKDLGRICGPLDEASLQKTLLISVKSKFVGKKEQCLMAISSVYREYFFYGKEKHTWFARLVGEFIKHYELEHLVIPSNFPSYEVLLDDYMKNSVVDTEYHLQTLQLVDFVDLCVDKHEDILQPQIPSIRLIYSGDELKKIVI
jgi:hypothetical protein